MSHEKPSPWRHGKVALAAVTGFGLVLSPAAAFAEDATPAADTGWGASIESLETGVANGYQLAEADGTVYVPDAQWRVEQRVEGTPENTPLTEGTSMRTTFSPYGIAVDPDVDGEAVVITTTARQTAEAASGGEYKYGGGVVVYSASQGAPTDADRIFEYSDGSPVFSGPRRVAVDDARNLAYVTSLGSSRGGGANDGYVTVLDLTKRGTASVVAQVTVPDAAGAVGVAVDSENNRIYVGGYADRGESGLDVETLYVIDGSKIDTSKPTDFEVNDGAVSALDAVVGGNARPTFNADTKKVYVSAYNDSKITVVNADPASAEYGKSEKVIDVVAHTEVEGERPAIGTNAVEVDAERGLLFSANLDAGVTVYDIENGYEQVEFTAEDGSKYWDIATSGRAVNFGVNEETGEVWVSQWSSAGKVDIITLDTREVPVESEAPVESAPAETIEYQTSGGTNAGTVTLPAQVTEGATFTISGTGFLNKDGAGSRIAVKLDGGAVSPKTEIPEAEELDGVWAVIDADASGSFTAEIEYPTVENSNIAEGAWASGTAHNIALLTGSLPIGDDQTIARGGKSPNFSIVAPETATETVRTSSSTSVDTGVKNGYQLAYSAGTVYVPDAQWTTTDAVGTGKVVLIDAASKAITANHDYTQLRRNDGVLQAPAATTEASGKVVVFDTTSKQQTGTHDFTGLTRNDGSGLKDSEPFAWADDSTATSQTSMRTTFSPYGIAVDPDVDGEAVVITTTARQTAEAASGGEYKYGGGVVVYSASQGAPTDADRIFEYSDGSPVFSGPRRVAVDDARNLAYVTSLGSSRGGGANDGYVTVLDLTKRGTASVVAQVTVPDAAGAVGVAVDSENNRIYVGGYADRGESGLDVETLYVIDGSKIDTSKPTDFEVNDGAVSALDAVVGGNARPTFNADTKKVYVSAYNDSKITVVNADPASAEYGKSEKVIDVVAHTEVEGERPAIGTNAVEVDAERGLLFSANLDAGVTVYDIENGYEQVEFTAEDGSKYWDIATSGRAVNFGVNEETGEVWVSQWSSAGKVDIIDVTKPEKEFPFVDVDPASVHYKAINWLFQEGLTTGTSATEYSPKANMNRAQMALFLYRLAGEPAVELPEQSPFPDVAEGDVSYKAIVWLDAEGLTNGVKKGGKVIFDKSGSVTRGQMAAFIYRSAGSPEYTAPEVSEIDDIASSTFYSEINWLADQGITTPYTTSSGEVVFRPKNEVLREQIASFIYRWQVEPATAG